nr:hypothetical protein [uncultured Duganella sp.]
MHTTFMRTISFAAAFTKNRDVPPSAAKDFQALRLPAIAELTPDQRAHVSGGPQVKNEPQT